MRSLHLKNGILVGFNTDDGSSLGIVCGRIPGKQLTLVRHLLSDKGVRKIPLENLEVLGEPYEGEDSFSLIERHTGAITMYLARR